MTARFYAQIDPEDPLVDLQIRLRCLELTETEFSRGGGYVGPEAPPARIERAAIMFEFVRHGTVPGRE